MHNGEGKKDVPLNCRAKLRFAWNGQDAIFTPSKTLSSEQVESTVRRKDFEKYFLSKRSNCHHILFPK